MRRLLLGVLIGLGIALLSGCGATGESKNHGDSDAQRLPAVTLQGLRAGDRSVDLGHLKGPMVVNLWAQWCGPCRREMGFYQSFHRNHPEIKVLGVDWMDPRADLARKLAAENKVSYPLVRDPDPKIPGRALPKVILIDKHGEIAHQEFVEIKSEAQLNKLTKRYLSAS